MDIFKYDSYVELLKDQIEQRRRSGIMGELSRAAGCDRTYLSQVLSGKSHLTTDHAINLSEAFSFSEAEGDFFLLLVMKDRSSHESAKSKLRTKLDKMRREHLNLTKKIKSSSSTNELPDELKLLYYSSWKPSAVHILTSLKGFQTVAGLSKGLRISEGDIIKILRDLMAAGLVEQKGQVFFHSGSNIHLPAQSPLIGLNHFNWRFRALENVTAIQEGVHYTDVFAISSEDLPKIKSLLLEFVESLRKVIHGSGSEEAQVFCCDLFSLIDQQ